MKLFPFVLLFNFSLVLIACGQEPSGNKISEQTILNNTTMDLSIISNSTVRNAITALQNNDLNHWYSFFTDNVVFTDDGNTLNFKSFFDNAFAQKEKYLSIDKVEDDGKSVYGQFYAGKWGTFNVYFKFHVHPDGKIYRLDIGQL